MLGSIFVNVAWYQGTFDLRSSALEDAIVGVGYKVLLNFSDSLT